MSLHKYRIVSILPTAEHMQKEMYKRFNRYIDPFSEYFNGHSTHTVAILLDPEYSVILSDEQIYAAVSNLNDLVKQYVTYENREYKINIYFQEIAAAESKILLHDDGIQRNATLSNDCEPPLKKISYLSKLLSKQRTTNEKNPSMTSVLQEIELCF